jgi:dTMP kinase
MKRGKGYFSFEGIDGSGKTTQAQLLSRYLTRKGYDVVVCHEPGTTIIGERIQSILLDPERKEMSPLTELCLYNASRAQLLSEVVIPALYQNKVVILDRFYDSTLAYQGFGREIDKDVIKVLDRIIVRDMKPELTFFLTIDITEARRRNQQAVKGDRFDNEALEFYQKVAEGYYHIAQEESERFKIIDAQGKSEDIHKKILALIEDHGFFRHKGTG